MNSLVMEQMEDSVTCYEHQYHCSSLPDNEADWFKLGDYPLVLEKKTKYALVDAINGVTLPHGSISQLFFNYTLGRLLSFALDLEMVYEKKDWDKMRWMTESIHEHAACYLISPRLEYASNYIYLYLRQKQHDSERLDHLYRQLISVLNETVEHWKHFQSSQLH